MDSDLLIPSVSEESEEAIREEFLPLDDEPRDLSEVSWYAPEPGDEPILLLELSAPDESLVDGGGLRLGVLAGFLSAAFHLWLLMTLAGIAHQERRSAPVAPIETTMAETETPPVVLDDEEEIQYELANPDDRELEVRQVVNASSVGIQKTEKPMFESRPEFTPELDPNRTAPPAYDIPQGAELDERLVVRGTTGENLVQLESALDLVTWEIAQNLKERKVLVVWMLDASASLNDQRATIARRLKRIYGELNALEKVGEIPRLETPLLSAVVSYGQNHAFLTKDPTDKFEAVREAFETLKTDESGVENVFTAVSATIKRWGHYRSTNGRRIMLICVTDETGDDFGQPFEQSISLCRRYGAKAYVIGPSAVFGRRKGYVPYVAPENGRTYDLPVDLGPESAMLENLHIPFWFEGPQYNYLSSGFGPYALSRLVSETGGVYFMTNMTTMDGLTPLGSFESGALKPFQPDYRFGSREEFEADLRKHPLRAAVVNAALLAEQYQSKDTPALELRVTPENFRQEATRAQEKVAESELALNMILQAFPPNIEKQLEREASPRWRAAFCLSYGRLLAQRVRCVEYNSAMAAMKSNLSPQDVGTRSNHWIIRPDREVTYAPSMKRSAKMAEELLRRVIDEAPGTPWAMLAARELQDPFGLRVVERFIPPPPPRPPAPAQPPRRTVQLAADPQPPRTPQRPTPPPPPPKLPKL